VFLAQPAPALAVLPAPQPPSSGAATEPGAAEAAEPAEASEPAEQQPATSPSLIGNITIFNDEIVEPVSVPVSLCGVSLASTDVQQRCGKTSVSDDDA